MKISLNWLKEYIAFQEKPEAVSDLLTQSGLEVEGLEDYESIKGGLQGLIIGDVLTCEKHPNADKLKKTTVNIGNDVVVPIVCGAPNVAAGQKVVVAPVGTELYPSEGDSFKIKKVKIRGEVSEGMICAEDEIGLGDEHDGIMELDTELPAGTSAADYFQTENDKIIEIGLTPNRADATSHIGVARDLKALLDTPVKWPSVEKFSIDDNSLSIPVTVENTEACPRYSSLTITNVTVKDSPDWLQSRLKSIGLAPISNIVDITNFVMHELGQPMHAFDADKIIGGKVIVKTLPKGSKFTTLDEKERTLRAHDLMICNEKEGMCIGGVFGGTKSGITEATKNVFLESAYFSPSYIRKTAQHHGLKTDASFRYERGTDPNMTVFALKRAAMLIKEIAGGSISSEISDIYPERIEDFKIKVVYKNIDRLIGKVIDRDRIEKILTNLDISLSEKDSEGFLATVPPYRVDVQRQADIIEEILRIYGFNNVELPAYLNSDFLAEHDIKSNFNLRYNSAELLAALGFNEIMTNSLTKETYAEETKSLDEVQNVLILNKLSEDLGTLRQSLVFTGLEVVAHNINRKQSDLKLFEYGTIYKLNSDNYSEQDRLSLFITGNKTGESWLGATEKIEFHDLYAVVRKILNKFSVDGLETKVVHDGFMSYGLSLIKGDKNLVTLGLLNNSITKLCGVTKEIFYADFDWKQLVAEKPTKLKIKEISKYPAVRRDLSLVIGKNVSFEEIQNIAQKNGGALVKEINVFDVYQGDKIDQNKKAYAMSFTLQDVKKTLTDKIIDKTMKRLISSFERELNAHIRK